MHRLGYIHAMASSIALILLTLLAGSASAELFAPEVFSQAPLYAPTAEPDESNGLYNTRLLPETESTEPASSQARLNSHWISLPVKAPQHDQPPPGLRF
ncbi:hypothetical protein [Pseudomonas sp. 1928-m]|uniref:hypothetical protein n=1 Tax=Pseudomonas sp. 1928-m TaxID=3033804 RepID=UPI0023DED5A1|nr:hypothetical protein [Pseudomonas sp. 1928-m]MDF3196722.1 hypothetical protein [Pseudomonas sp. 1928-m]